MTIKSRIEVQDDRRHFPGPGAYYGLNSTISSALQQKFRSSSSEELIHKPRNRFNSTKYTVKRQQPNASTYSPNERLILPSASKCVIGTSAKSEFLKEVAERKFEPGPGNYETAPNKKGPFFSVKARIPHPDENGVPGPGSYDIDNLFVKVKKDKVAMNFGARHTSMNLSSLKGN